MPTQLLRKLPQQSKVCEIAPLRQYRYSATTGTKLRDNYNLLQKQSQVGFDPSKFAMGFLGGSAGSVAVSKGFRFLKDNPQYKEALKKELADTLSKGWEATTKQYPLLETIARPNYIAQNQKGRIAQAGNILNKLQETFLQNNLINEKALNTHATKLPKPLSKEEFLAQIPNKDTLTNTRNISIMTTKI